MKKYYTDEENLEDASIKGYRLGVKEAKIDLQKQVFDKIDEWAIEFNNVLSPTMSIHNTPIRRLKDKLKEAFK